MVTIKELTDELIAYCDKIGVEIVGFSDTTNFDKFNKEHRPDSYLSNSNL